jgi:RHS repeat-associated protein
MREALLNPVIVAAIFATINGPLAPRSARAAVNAYGEFLTEIPAAVPSFHGLEPKLTLLYHSTSANGWTGAGWSVSGGPSYIVRASAGRGAAHFDASDIFLLDGDELISCAAGSPSPSCRTGGSHSMKIENYRRIQHNIGSANSDDSWKVWDKNGTVSTYTPHLITGRGIYRWALTNKTDTHGNTLKYEYWCDSGTASNECYLDKITYNDIVRDPCVDGGGGIQICDTNPVLMPGTIIVFLSEPREDRAVYGTGAGLVLKRYRLHAIDIVRGLKNRTYKRLRTYQLTYYSSVVAGTSLLDSLQQFGTDAVVNCGAATGDPCDATRPPGFVLSGTSLPSRGFQYDSTATGSFQYRVPQPPPSWCNTAGNCLSFYPNHVIVGDFNGDGKADFMSATGNFDTWLSQGDGSFQYSAASNIPNWCTNPADGTIAAQFCISGEEGKAVVGDFDGDGRTDFLSAMDNFEVFLSNGDGSFRHASSVVVDASTTCSSARACLSGVPAIGGAIIGDFDGDGKTDFMSPYSGDSAHPETDRFNTWLSNGDGTFRLVSSAPPAWCEDPLLGRRASLCVTGGLNHVIVGDFNGDGKTDFLVAKGGAGGPIRDFRTFLSIGDGTFMDVAWSPPSWCADSSGTPNASHCLSYDANHVVIGDFNGDGLTDFMSANGNFDTFLARGDGTFTWLADTTPRPLFCSAGAYLCLSKDANDVVVGDFNGDGRTDFMSANDNFDTWISRGDGRFLFTTSAPPPTCPRAADCLDSTLINNVNMIKGLAGHVIVGDFTGSGKIGFLSANTNFDIWTAVGGPPDYLTGFHNGTRGFASIEYRPSSAWKNGYLPAGLVFQTTFRVTTDDGRGVSDTQEYEYEGALWSDSERRLLGFHRVKAVLDADKNFTEHIFRQTPACLSQPVRAYLKDKDASVYRYTTYSYAPTGPSPYRCLLTDVSNYECERTCKSDIECSRTCRTSSVRYSYDMYANASMIQEYGDDRINNDERTTERGFFYNEPAYIVGSVGFQNVYQGAGTSSERLERKQFVYDNNKDAAGNPRFDLPPTKGDLTDLQLWDNKKGSYYTTTYKYDAIGNVFSTIDARKNESTVKYDDTYHLYVRLSCNAKGQCWEQDWDEITGAVVTKKDPQTDGNTYLTTYTYDFVGRPLRTTTPDGEYTEKEYLDFGLDSQRIRESVNDGTQEGLWSESYFDGLGRTYRVSKKGGSEKLTEFRDASQNAARESNWYYPPSDADWTEYQYDGAKRVTQITNPGGSIQRTIYGVKAGPTPLPYVQTIDEANHEKVYSKDVFNRVMSIVEKHIDRCAHPVSAVGVALVNGCSSCTVSVCATNPSCCRAQWDAACTAAAAQFASGDVSYTTTYTYDALDRLVQTVDAAGNVSITEWDSLGRKISVSDPDMGYWKYDFDEVGNLVQQTDARGRSIAVIYDSLNRVARKTYSDGAAVIFTYDGTGRGASSGASKGRLTDVAAFAPAGPLLGIQSFDYDSMGRNTIVKNCWRGKCASTKSQYDLAGRLKEVTYPDSFGQLSPDSEVITYGYREDGRLNSVTGLNAYIVSMEYNAAGQAVTITYGNQTTSVLDYDRRRLWLNTATISGPGSQGAVGPTLYNAVYTHADDGVLGSIVSSTNPALNVMLYHDALHRLVETRGSQNSGLDQRFTYDPIGNLTYNLDVGAYTYPGPPDPRIWPPPMTQPHTVRTAGANTYGYDENGNMISGGGRTVEWDDENRLLKVTVGNTVTQFEYDGSGQRMLKIEPAGTSTYLGRLVEIDVAGKLVYNYYAGSTLIARRDQSSGLQWYHSDNLNSVVLATNSLGAVVRAYDYKAFGETSTGASASAEYGFGGHKTNVSTRSVPGDGAGLIYMGSRYYDATLGRFLSADSVAPNTANPQSLNRYSYVSNDPFSFQDPTGHTQVPPEPSPERTAIRGEWESVMVCNVPGGGCRMLSSWVGGSLAGAGTFSESGEGTGDGGGEGKTAGKREEIVMEPMLVIGEPDAPWPSDVLMQYEVPGIPREDEFSIRVKMPKDLPPELFLSQFLADPNGTLRSTAFNTFMKFSPKDASRPPRLGDIYHIDIAGPFNGSVMLTEQGSSHFVFTTVTTKEQGQHPETGMREFGFERNRDGTVTFFTRGVSIGSNWFFRATGPPIQFSAWKQLMKGVGGAITERGGTVVPNSLTTFTRENLK